MSSLVTSATEIIIEVKDKTKANQLALENTEGVISVEERNGQFLVKVEGTVENLYKEISKLGDFNSDDEKESVMNKILEIIGGSFGPILGVLAGAGLLSALLAVLTMLGWVSTESGTYAIFSAAGHAVFYFLPIFLGITLAIKLGANAYVGGTIGAALLEPHFTDLIGKGAQHVDFIGIPVVLMNYSSTVFPIFIAVSIYAVLEKFLKKVIYKDIQMFINPLISLVIIVPLTVLCSDLLVCMSERVLGSYRVLKFEKWTFNRSSIRCRSGFFLSLFWVFIGGSFRSPSQILRMALIRLSEWLQPHLLPKLGWRLGCY